MQTFEKKFKVHAEAEVIYAALTHPLTIELWSGYPAIMNDQPDTEFSLWEGDITGINLEMERGKKIVQEWFFGEQEERSIVTILISQEKQVSQVTVKHTNIPDDAYENIKEGWEKYYMGAVQKFFSF